MKAVNEKIKTKVHHVQDVCSDLVGFFLGCSMASLGMAEPVCNLMEVSARLMPWLLHVTSPLNRQGTPSLASAAASIHRTESFAPFSHGSGRQRSAMIPQKKTD